MLLSLVYVAMVVIAIGLLIFIHELGHFLVAKKVGIRVDAFALGFGPRLFGFTRGETEYKVCVLPLGGYVKMAGEAPGEGSGDPRDFASKTIAQRAWVVSAGVIMNVIFAFILFPIAFSIGVPVSPPLIGDVAPASPAWEGGLRAGDRILAVDDGDVISFEDVRMDIAFSSEEPTVFRIDRDGEVLERTVTPRYDETIGFNVVGISPVYELRLRRDVELPEGARAGDQVVAIDGVSVESFQADAETLERWNSGASDLVLGLRAPDETEVREVRLPASFVETEGETRWRLGILRSDLRVERVAPGPAGGLAAALGIAPGDVVRSVQGRPVHARGALRDALRDAADDDELVVEVERAGARIGLRHAPGDVAPVELLDALHLGPTTVDDGAGVEIAVMPNSPAEAAGLKNGVVLRGVVAADTTTLATGSFDWNDLVTAVQASKGEPVTLETVSGGEPSRVVVRPEVQRANQALAAVTEMRAVQERVRVPFPRSVVVGFEQTVVQLEKLILSVRSLVMGDVSPKHMGGIITIAVVSYGFAEQGLAKILFFMGILSLNLALLNILPIPVLDGGHLLFLVLEKIKGAPLSDRAMGFAHITGLVLILGLFVFVTFNDIVRLIV